jgi:hypothetical protein
LKPWAEILSPFRGEMLALSLRLTRMGRASAQTATRTSDGNIRCSGSDRIRVPAQLRQQTRSFTEKVLRAQEAQGKPGAQPAHMGPLLDMRPRARQRAATIQGGTPIRLASDFRLVLSIPRYGKLNNPGPRSLKLTRDAKDRQLNSEEPRVAPATSVVLASATCFDRSLSPHIPVMRARSRPLCI